MFLAVQHGWLPLGSAIPSWSILPLPLTGDGLWGWYLSQQPGDGAEGRMAPAGSLVAALSAAGLAGITVSLCWGSRLIGGPRREGKGTVLPCCFLSASSLPGMGQGLTNIQHFPFRSPRDPLYPYPRETCASDMQRDFRQDAELCSTEALPQSPSSSHNRRMATYFKVFCG